MIFPANKAVDRRTIPYQESDSPQSVPVGQPKLQ